MGTVLDKRYRLQEEIQLLRSHKRRLVWAIAVLGVALGMLVGGGLTRAVWGGQAEQFARVQGIAQILRSQAYAENRRPG